MSVLLITAAIIAVAVGYLVYNKKKKKVKEKENENESSASSASSATDSEVALESEEQSFDNMFDSLLETESEDNSTNHEDAEPKNVILKLNDRSWWDVSGSLVLSYLFMAIVVCLFVFLSVFCHSAYNNRINLEQHRADSLKILKEASINRSLEKEEGRMLTLEAKLDSIDLHIRALKPVKKASPKPKKQKK